MLTPTGTLPVNATMCVSLCSTNDFPAAASPVTTWNNPSGNALKASANNSVVRDVYCEGLIMTAFPAAKAALASHASNTIG